MKKIFSFGENNSVELLQEHMPVIKSSPLFIGASEKEINSMLTCLGGTIAKCDKDKYIFHANDNITDMGLVLSGSLRLERNDYWGNRSILSYVGRGEIFGEVFACEPLLSTSISAVANEESMILFMNVQRIATMCGNNCIYHSQLIHNLLSVMAKKAYMLTSKINHVSKRTTREKLLSYFSEQVLLSGSTEFSIPFSRQELADFLSVNRSAMCVELSKMQTDGIINFNKNRFELLTDENPM
ncbi:Crp/Fnr family transcriptional regulator [Pectinatus brassicae]|uniref:CRP-like cAMP-binding protein n=1 Tax=Pectinatus brassicae TaxID=862415 RepID=A0A840UVY6_9FIRM|nr:Crp/Fnr family transcriptional regulator [Pectinatus brassicae]MBB5336595.1 CRP-like cAMP-binding protein [Pectinatus brassicae]